jgi:hypothetical protein
MASLSPRLSEKRRPPAALARGRANRHCPPPDQRQPSGRNGSWRANANLPGNLAPCRTPRAVTFRLALQQIYGIGITYFGRYMLGQQLKLPERRWSRPLVGVSPWVQIQHSAALCSIFSQGVLSQHVMPILRKRFRQLGILRYASVMEYCSPKPGHRHELPVWV